MRNFLTYLGVFVVAVVLQLLILDSVRVSIWFAPLAYTAFIILLPVKTKPLAVLLLGFATGVFMDLFEGAGGLHTAATLLAAYARRRVIILTLGRDTVEEAMGMPSPKLLGTNKFLRYSAVMVTIHSLAFFTLEALGAENYLLVLLKVFVSAVATLLAVWAVALLFSVRTPRKI